MKGFQRGSLMVEVMVSSLIGTLLLYGALSIMLNSRISFKAREGLSRIEERGRLAVEIVADDIRLAGYKGCVSSGGQDIIRAVDISSDWVQPELGVRGWAFSNTEYGDDLDVHSLQQSAFTTGNWQPNDPGSKGTGIDMLQRSDVLELWVAQPFVMDISGATITDSLKQLTAVPSTMDGFPDSSEADPERLLLVSDCSRNILVKADSFGSTGLVTLDSIKTNSHSSQLTSMSQPQAVMIQGIMYYLSIPSDRDRPSLYKKEVNADGTYRNAIEVLPGVLNLQFQFGENTDTELSADRYVDANEVSDWSNVISVRIYMLVETEIEDAVPDGMEFFFFGRTYSPANSQDKRIRREYTTTVTLRNRSLGLIVTGDADESAP
ncbi:PilW family protein [Parendozoicomonas sp. Alg238-R29]|uniref:PilW family protein n=1 Tax=Parendozoicomonas sp. Alg238-R29 TaxID=2993446 RepID=UPI00248DF94F|nr:PilW family protein [Parendozoicomonas sp. Alg238-R29]